MIEQVKAQIIVEIDDKSLKQSEKELKRMQDPVALKMYADLAQLRQELKLVRSQIARAEKDGDLSGALDLRVKDEILRKEITKANKEVTNFVRTGDKELSVLGKLFEKVGIDFDNSIGSRLLDAGKGLAGGALVTALGLGVTKAGELAGKFETVNISLTTMLGSQEKATMLLQDLNALAKESPLFGTVEIRDVAKGLLANNIELENIIPTIKMLGDVSAGTGTDLGRITYAYGQVRAATKLTGNELRQFTEAGVPLLSELAKNFGTTEAEIRKMIEGGKVSFGDLQKAFTTMTSEGGKFFDLGKQMADTLPGKWASLTDQVTQDIEAIGKSSSGFISGFIDLMGWLWTRFMDLGKAGGILFTLLASGFEMLGYKVSTVANWVVNAFKGAFMWLGENAGTVAENIGIAFDNIPVYIAQGLNKALKMIESFVNSSADLLNGLGKGLGMDFGFSKIKIGHVNGGQAKAFKALGGFDMGDFSQVATQNQRKVDFAVSELKKSLEAYGTTTRPIDTKIKPSQLSGGTSEASKSGGSGGTKQAKKELEDYTKEAKKNAQDIIKEEIDLRKKWLEAIKNSLDKAKDAQKEYDDIRKKGQEQEIENTKKIAERYRDIGDELKSLQESQLGIDEQTRAVAERLGQSAFNLSAGGIDGIDKIREYLSNKEAISKLESERKMAGVNTTSGAIATANLSPTEAILAQAETDRKALEQERMAIEQKTGLKEEEAKKLIELETNKYNRIQEQAIAYEEALKLSEQSMTTEVKNNTVERIKAYEAEEARLRSLVNLRLRANQGIINNTVNNSTNVIVNADIANNLDLDNVGKRLAEKIQLSSKGIN